jgi:hypothetical protein
MKSPASAARFTMALKVSWRIYGTHSPFRDIRSSLREVAMQDNCRLADISKRLEDATNQLREQQSLVSHIGCPRRHRALLMLLSNGLRVYYWMRDQRRRLQEQTGK